MSEFENDSRIEKLNSYVLEKSVLKDTFTSFERANEREIQKQHIDYICQLHNNQLLNVDIKEASDFFIRPWDLATFIIEVGNTNHSDNTLNIGWGIEKSLTTHWLFVKPLIKCDESKICLYFETILVDRIQMLNIISTYYKNICEAEIFPEQLKVLYNNAEMCNENIEECCKFIFVHCKHWYNKIDNRGTTRDNGKPNIQKLEMKAIGITCSLHKDEGPINIVVPWRIYQVLADKLDWQHKIYWTDMNTYKAFDYNDDYAKINLGVYGNTYIDNLNKRVNQSYLDDFIKIANSLYT